MIVLLLLCSSGTGRDPVSKLGDMIYIVVTEKFSSVWKPGKSYASMGGKFIIFQSFQSRQT